MSMGLYLELVGPVSICAANITHVTLTDTCFHICLVPVPSFAADQLVAASFLSASIGLNLPRTDVPSVEKQLKLLKSFEEKRSW